VKLSIIPIDQAVYIDGFCIHFDFDINDSIHAVQWDGISGHIEYKDGEKQKIIDNVDEFQNIIDFHKAKRTVIDEQNRIKDKGEKIKKKDRGAFKQTYIYLRQTGYPRIADQLDMLWHSMESGEIQKAEAFYNALRSVKDKYPKS